MRLFPRTPKARRWAVALLVVAVLVPVGAVGLTVVVNARSFQLFGEITHRVETDAKVVALTFDDGPDPAGTRPMLAVLAAKDVRGTFYLTGRELSAHPELGRAVAEAGHEIGNHSYSHERMVFVTPGWVAEEVEETDSLIRSTGYTGPITFRPPHGKKLIALPRYLAEHGRRTVTWDVETDSGPDQPASADELARRTVEQVRPGSIVLLHGMYAGRGVTRDAIGPIIDLLRDRGYRFATVSELLARAR
ncbi:polysaccharide deacetylase family protein [Actinosynnema sp. NPDC047251]|uniref:Chitooligosaccharide deacetylase n=1 Tax=Saccharothrix espanaensis (strain ATCC 51144 / DSM 44229 / JCM 9112 / NBRC 15066 / NRRL 15764) TaxID=1179773 RepID=K0JU41_SACES|nr:polysaccharide deacetylase family protein [Saccharothrix espanaensis]CCH31340.1 Chitooligosaccharide deacetylase [Saccharothrix espanaensis DSM 44229]